MLKGTIDVLNVRPAVRVFLKEKSFRFEIEHVEKLLSFLASKQCGCYAHENGVSGHSSVNQRNQLKLFTEGWTTPVLHKMDLINAEEAHPVGKLVMLKQSIKFGGREGVWGK